MECQKTHMLATYETSEGVLVLLIIIEGADFIRGCLIQISKLFYLIHKLFVQNKEHSS